MAALMTRMQAQNASLLGFSSKVNVRTRGFILIPLSTSCGSWRLKTLLDDDQEKDYIVVVCAMDMVAGLS